MSNPCGGLTLSPYSGDICQHGYVNGVLMSEDKLSAITETNAALEATWTALLLADQSARLFSINFDVSEPAENEIVEYEVSNGSTIILSSKEGTNKYRMVSSNAALISIYGEFKDGKEMYIYEKTSKGFIRGKEVTANTIEQVKVRVYAQYTQATPTDPAFVDMYIQNLEEWKKYQNAVDPTDNFDPSALSSVQNMTFTSTDDTLTTLTVEAKDLDKVGITSLDTVGAGQWILTNTTGSAVVTVTGITRTGYSYVLAFTGQTEGNAWSLGYEEPSTSDEYYDLKTVITGTFTA